MWFLWRVLIWHQDACNHYDDMGRVVDIECSLGYGRWGLNQLRFLSYVADNMVPPKSVHQFTLFGKTNMKCDLQHIRMSLNLQINKIDKTYSPSKNDFQFITCFYMS